MRIVIVAILVCLVLVWIVSHKQHGAIRAAPPAPGVIPKNSVFHKPLRHVCPNGTTLVAGYFTERDGSKVDACHNPNGDGSIDYLHPGESCSIGIEVESAPESTGPKT